MHHGFVAATLVLGIMPAVLIAVAIVWYRRGAPREGGRLPPHSASSRSQEGGST